MVSLIIIIFCSGTGEAGLCECGTMGIIFFRHVYSSFFYFGQLLLGVQFVLSLYISSRPQLIVKCFFYLFTLEYCSLIFQMHFKYHRGHIMFQHLYCFLARGRSQNFCVNQFKTPCIIISMYFKKCIRSNLAFHSSTQQQI